MSALVFSYKPYGEVRRNNVYIWVENNDCMKVNGGYLKPRYREVANTISASGQILVTNPLGLVGEVGVSIPNEFLCLRSLRTAYIWLEGKGYACDNSLAILSKSSLNFFKKYGNSVSYGDFLRRALFDMEVM